MALSYIPPKFPRTLLQAASVDWNLTASVITPGQSGVGAFSYERMDGGGQWLAKMNSLRLMTRDHVAAFRAFRIQARGGVTLMEIYREDILQPWQVNGEAAGPYAPIPHSDGSWFSDGSGYYQPYIHARTVGSTAERATSIVMRFSRGGPLRGGEPFSIKHPTQLWRMYEVATVLINSDGDSVVTFDPPLREIVADDTRIEFDRPRCTMRAFSVDAMNFTLETKPLPRPSATFLEASIPA